MFGAIGRGFQGLDDRMLGHFGRKGAQTRLEQIRAIENDYRSRMGGQNPAVDSVGASIADALRGQKGFERDAVIQRLKAGENPGSGVPLADVSLDDLYGQAAASTAPGPMTRLNYMMAGRDTGSRIGQGAVIGGAVGGVTLGMTAAGQGLMALMDYMNQGQQVASARDQELTS